jgi:RNA polymerase sigma-70 factor (ECF subfamily)
VSDDSELVSRAKAGDFGAFETLVSRHERRLYGVAMNILRRPQDAEDVVQSAFLGALEGLDTFRGEASFGTWISRIATFAAIKVLRKRKGLPVNRLDVPATENEDGLIQHPDFIADWREGPEQIAERKETRQILDEAIDALPEKHRLVFALRDVAEMSVKDTAEALGISEANVKVRLLRARLALREMLTKRFGDENRPLKAHRHAGEEAGATAAQRILDSYRDKQG